MTDILFTEPAEYDLLDIEYYIHVHLCNRQAADRIVGGILSEVRSLGQFPMEHPVVPDELLSDLGLRMMRFDHYNIFYYYDEENEVGHIIRILYNRSVWKCMLQP